MKLYRIVLLVITYTSVLAMEDDFEKNKIESIKTWLMVLEKLGRADIVSCIKKGTIKDLIEDDRQLIEGFGLIEGKKVAPLVIEYFAKKDKCE